MSNKKKKSIQEVSTHKKVEVLGSENKKKKILPYAILSICAIFCVGAVMMLEGVSFTSQNRTVIESKDVGRAQVVTHPINLFDDGKAKHFEVKTHNDITIKYFVLKSSDGVIRAAFDACDVCWPSGKGYFQEGDNMVCRNCGKRFASVKINEVKGGCNPAPLARRIEGESLLIQAADIQAGQSYFDFQGRHDS
jgi:uncharacterized membrane protein